MADSGITNEALSRQESGIDRVANQARRHTELLTQAAEEKNGLGGVLETWSSDFEAKHPATNEQILTAIAEIMAPQNRHGTPRWQLVEADKRTLDEPQTAHVMSLAQDFGMLLPKEAETPQDLLAGPEIFAVVEGGANRTAVVRRNLVLELLADRARSIGQLNMLPVFQLGSHREILRVRQDGSPNAEYQVAQEICGQYFPRDEKLILKDSITEQELNIHSALSEGWVKGFDFAHSLDGFDQATQLVRSDNEPKIFALLSANTNDGGLPGLPLTLERLLAVRAQTENIGERQLVVATNGQYRPKDEIQAAIACLKSGVDPANIRAIGDETGQRGPNVYTREIGVLARLILEFNTELVNAGRPNIV